MTIRPAGSRRSRAGAVIGIDIGGTKIDVACATDDGRILHRVRLETLASLGPSQALDRIADAVEELVRRASRVDGLDVHAYAAASPGVVKDSQILLAPNLPGWEDLALAHELAARLSVDDVAVSNDVQAGALAESRNGALRGADPAVYLSLGTGVAAALVIGGRVVPGAHRAAGEIAYLIPTGPQVAVPAGDAAPLEELVGGKALGEAATALLGFPVTAQELFRRRDRESRRLVEASLDSMSAALANIAVFIDPERIAVGGGMMASADVIMPALAHRLKNTVPFAPELVAARFTEDASLHGAVAMALDGLAERTTR